MGADRRGPLAAFIIVAVIAGILLVTSVRSQAAPGWLNPEGLPATVAAAPVTGSLDQIVREGVVLVHRADTDAVEDDTRIESVGPSTSVATSGTHRSRTPRHVASTRRHHATVTPHHTLSPPHQPSHGAPSAPPPADPAPPRHDHRRHLGWAEHHGQDDTSDDTADEPPAEGPAEAPDEHQHGNGHAYGHEKHQGNGDGHGDGHGNGHEKQQDED